MRGPQVRFCERPGGAIPWAYSTRPHTPARRLASQRQDPFSLISWSAGLPKTWCTSMRAGRTFATDASPGIFETRPKHFQAFQEAAPRRLE